MDKVKSRTTLLQIKSLNTRSHNVTLNRDSSAKIRVMKFKAVSSSVSFPALEEETLKYWKENKIFEKTLEKVAPNGNWTFLDGPPFVTGMPHYGTLLSSIPKDVFGRYWTMKGFHVRRVWGWDGHGLPIENKVENKLKIKRKKDIEDVIGVGKFIAECLGYVQEVSAEWEWYVDHIGRWVDFKNAYKTWDLPYMETVMWVFKNIYDKGYIYKGLRVSLYCPHCVTPISNFEVAMDADNYKDVTEPSNVYKYQLADEKNTFLLAWSTTPWTKIATTALAVNPNIDYVKVRQGGEIYILAKTRMEMLLSEPKLEIIEEFKGNALLGKKFVGHFDYFKHEPDKKVFEVIGGEFVTATEGTGIVTVAAYGEEDLAVMNKFNVQIILHLDEEGKIKSEVGMFSGESYLSANPKINAYLAEKNLVYREDSLTHSVPTCWRCHERLIYAPQNAWFMDIQKLKKQLAETNELVNWYPDHFKHGRFLNSLDAAPDWCISRSRYWGSPVPVWECSNGHRFVPGSIAELQQASGTKIDNLHKPGIDEITITCLECGKPMKRTPEVLDSWMEAGSASFAERHYPFAGSVPLKSFFPPDFIVEYTGQIRAWFYVLHVISNAMLGSIAFKNVSVTGVILGTDGRKMSKNYGNYPDPKQLLSEYGGDALRLYLLGSPVMNGEDIRISEEEYRDQIRSFLLIFWNVYSFFVNYAEIDKWQPNKDAFSKSPNILDSWILSRLQSLVIDVTAALEKFNTPQAVTSAKSFAVKDLSTWYVRRIRDRIGPTAENGPDKNAAYQTLWTVLVTFSKILAPLTPFVAEEIYLGLTGEVSVHMADWPTADESLINKELDYEMEVARQIVEQGHAQRKLLQIKVKQPLSSLSTKSPITLTKEVESLIKDELNIKTLDITKVPGEPIAVKLNSEITDELKKEGQAREIIRSIQEARKEAKTTLSEKINVTLPDWPAEFEDLIKKQTLATSLIRGDKLSVERIK